MKKSSTMKEVMILSKLDQIKCMSQDYRLSILEAFDSQKASAKQISERMGEPHAKVNYHIKEMFKNEIIDLVGEEVKNGIVEKYYCPVAQYFVVDSKAMQYSEDLHESLTQYRMTLFDKLSTSFYNNIASEAQEGFFKMSMMYDFRLTKEQVEAMHKDFSLVMDKYRELADQNEDKNMGETLTATHLIMKYEDKSERPD